MLPNPVSELFGRRSSSCWEILRRPSGSWHPLRWVSLEQRPPKSPQVLTIPLCYTGNRLCSITHFYHAVNCGRDPPLCLARRKWAMQFYLDVRINCSMCIISSSQLERVCKTQAHIKASLVVMEMLFPTVSQTAPAGAL